MWTISKKQLIAISNSMRYEFERRACFAMMKEMKNLSESEIKDIIHIQTDKIVMYHIDKENAMMQFIRLSFEYPVLQAEVLPESLHEILSSSEDENMRLENLTNQLNINNYGI